METETIKLTNYELGFYPRRDTRKYILMFLVIYSLSFVIFYVMSKKLFLISDPHILGFYLYTLFTTLIFLVVWSKGSNPYFPADTDKVGGTRKDRVREWWNKVLSSQDKIFIERITVKKESYVVNTLPATNIETRLSTRMIWNGIVLFERNNEGDVSHLEGMPAILFLRD